MDKRTLFLILILEDKVEIVEYPGQVMTPPSMILLAEPTTGKVYRYVLKTSESSQKPKTEHMLVVVLDQMFHGFGKIIRREVPGEVLVVEILGRGIKSPYEQEGVLYWPAQDDYDVMKAVEDLAKKHGRAVLFTGDKKLARQTSMLLSGLGVEVGYMPPNEYPGKEAIVRSMLQKIRLLLGRESL
ncbi:MAG: hypothetical protein F7C36_01365 [Desulfurococcales archaeon]|nr:hypothetical protein [Desulfurococcales archaeon]